MMIIGVSGMDVKELKASYTDVTVLIDVCTHHISNHLQSKLGT